MNDWSKRELGDVVELKRGYDLPERLRSPGPVPVVSSSGISGRHSEAKVEPPGVVTGRYGTIGEVFLLGEPFWPLNTSLYVRDFKGNDPRFVFYLLKTVDYFRYSDKAAVPGVNRNHLHRAGVLIPPLAEQRAIARILGALDDKIELNREMNRTLEATAQAIFRSWFVDFEPVVAKADGRKPFGMTDDLAALFPDRFVESELGPIPEGWEVISIYELSDVVYGAPFKSRLFNDQQEGRPLIRIRDLRTHEPTAWTIEVHSREWEVEPGDIVVGMDGEFSVEMWRGPTSLLNQRVCLFDPKYGCPSVFLRLVLEEPMRFFERAKTGTTVIHLGKRDIDTIRVICPGDRILSRFEDVTEPMMWKVLTNESESQILVALRDLLLPRLLSGEIRVAEAEEAMEAAL